MDCFHEKESGTGAVEEADEALRELRSVFCLFVLSRIKFSLNLLV